MKVFEITSEERSLINMLVINERERLLRVLTDVSPTKDYLFFKAVSEEIRLCNETIEAIKSPCTFA